jgi:Tfp pilus assembly protein PilN
MRAVNLIPGDQRTGSPVGAGRSEGAAYAVLAVLAAFAVLALLYGKASRDVSSNKSKAATLTAEAQSAQAQASALAPYTTFASLREQRVQAVASLVDTRFDWAHAFHEFGRVLTGQTSISSLDGSIAAGTAAPAAATTAPPTSTTTTSTAAAAPSVSSATPSGSVPTFQLAGCATSQRTVAQMLQRLRLIDGVDEVTLQNSTKSVGATASAGCPSGAPAFAVTVTFDPLPTATAAAAAATGKAKTVAQQTPSTSTTAPTSAPVPTSTTPTSTTGGLNG